MPPQRFRAAVAVDAFCRQVVDDQPALRRHDDVVPPARDGPADEPFVVPVPVQGRGVEQADAGVQRLADDPDGLGVVAAALRVNPAHAHAPEADGHHARAACPQLPGAV